MATIRDRVAQILFRATTDNASFQRVEAQMNKITQGAKDMGGAFGSFAGSGAVRAGRALRGLNAGGLSDVFMTIDDINDVSEVAAKALQDMNINTKELAAGLGVAGAGVLAFTLLVADFNRRQAEAAAATKEGLKTTDDYNKFIANATTEDVKKKIDAYKEEQNALEVTLEQREGFVRRAKAIEGLFSIAKTAYDIDLAKEAASRFGEELKALGFDISKGISASVLTEALNETETQLQINANLQQKYTDALGSSSVQLNDAIKLEKENSDLRLKAAVEDGQRILAENEKNFAALARQNEQLAAAYQKYERDIANLQDTYQQDRIQAEKDYQQTLVDIADQAAKAAEDALARLTEKRDQLAADFAQGELDAQRQLELDRQQIIIDAQRQEAQAYRDHQRNLRDIQIEAARERERLAEDRDFAGLFDLERQTSQRMEDANRAFEDERQDRQMALEQERIDLLASYEIERQQRFEQYQRNLVDAQEQYKRELALAERNRREAEAKARQAFDVELRMLYEKLNADLAARKAAALAELELLNQTEAQKLAIIEQYATAARNFLASTFAPVTAPAGNSTSVAFTQNLSVSGGYGPMANSLIASMARNETRGVLKEYFG